MGSTFCVLTDSDLLFDDSVECYKSKSKVQL